MKKPTGNQKSRRITSNQLTRETPHSETNATLELLGKNHVAREDLTFLRKNPEVLSLIARAIRSLSKQNSTNLPRMKEEINSVLDGYWFDYGFLLLTLVNHGWGTTSARIRGKYLTIATSCVIERTIYEITLIVEHSETFKEIPFIKIYRSESAENPNGMLTSRIKDHNVPMDDLYKILENPAPIFSGVAGVRD